MTAEQLQAARAAHWRQQQNPILTLEDAQGWLSQHPLCLYLPRRGQLPAPAPSFVEACLGSAQATPGAAAIEQAQALLTRLTASGAVVPLNLLGTVGEPPDFLAHSEALPFVLSLRADSDWKHAPQKSSGHKVSPLVLELWKLLDQQGALTAAQARETLGRELTEAAVLRALSELWQALRISPVYAEGGQAAQWEMLRVRHREALATAGATGQVTAISLLVSMYLQSVYAATSEEIEVFLSPVTSRSRVREAVRGLSATRQIHSLSMAAQTYYFLENGLPGFAEAAAPVATEIPSTPLAARPRPRVHPATPAPSAPLPSPAKVERKPERRPAPSAGRSGWKIPSRPPASRGGNDTERRPPRPAAAARPERPGPERPSSERSDKDKFRPRPPKDNRRAGPYRPAGRPPTRPTGAPPDGNRPPFAGRPPGRPAFSSRPKFTPKPGRGGAPRGGPSNRPRPAGARPAFSREPGRGGPPGSAPSRNATAGATPRPSPGPGSRPGSGPNNNRPRPGGFSRPGAKPRPGGGQGRPAGSGRPPFKPRSGPPKSGPPRSGPRSAGNRPGKPPGDFPRRKPDRKKPGA